MKIWSYVYGNGLIADNLDNSTDIMYSVHEGWEWEGVGSQRWVKPYIGTEKQPLCAHRSRKRAAVDLSGWDSHWQQFNNKCSLNSATQWHHKPHSDYHEFKRSQKSYL